MSLHRPSRRRYVPALALASAVLLTAACGSGGAGTDAGASGSGESIPGIDADLVAAAQADGGVVLYAGGHTRETLELLQERMQELWGIQVTFTREDSAAIANSVSAELASGQLNADVISLTDPATMQDWADQGVTTDAGVSNLDDVVPGLDDPSNPQVPYSSVPLGIMYNSAETDPADLPTSWAELAAEGDASIVTADPGASGTALAAYTMLDSLLGETFIDDLSQQQVTVTDSSLALAQLVLTGEADIGVPAIESAVLSAAAGGEPLAIAYLDEGVPTFATEIAVLTDAPRPDAARLLVQYHLSEDFQERLVGIGARSALQGAEQPEGAADLSDATILTATLEEVGTSGPGVVSRFAEAFGR